MDQSARTSIPVPQIIAGRYDVEAVVGKGGMGVVYRVRDQTDGRALALKRLLIDDEKTRDRAAHLFQREYQTLAHLKHPRVVEVYEYGVHEQTPYYTMELLDGGDLSTTLALDCRTVCRLLCDVASALALLHSRRWVHRDITPRNVRRTADGRAKLFDFGTLATMGATAGLVGTAPYVAPEALHGQPLDGRVDIFALGALAYFLLTGREAYPARNFDQLREYFRSEPRAPNALVPRIPAQLSAFVQSLLSINRVNRPATAWEVIDRLSAIAQLEHDNGHADARAYLVTPTLVGRDRELQRARESLLSGLRGRGGSLCIEGPPGEGRSRMIAALALEARLLGFRVLRADGAEGRHGNFAVLAQLLGQLCELDVSSSRPLPPEIQRVIDLAQRPLDQNEENALLANSRDIFVHFFLGRAQQRLMLAIDDVQAVDSASSAVLRELMQAASHQRLVIACALRTESASTTPLRHILRKDAIVIELEPLRVEDTEALMRSVFGDAAHLRPLSHLVHRWAEGNPAACMSIAQQLLDRGAVQYQAGRWILPHDLAEIATGFEVESVFAARLQALGHEARTLAEALALSAAYIPLDPDDYGALLDEPDDLAGFAALTELIEHGVVRAMGGDFVFSHPALGEALLSRTDPARKRALHGRIAALYAGGRRRNRFMHAMHLQRAGEDRQALELLLELAKLDLGLTESGSAMRTNDWLVLAAQTYLDALKYALASGASRRSLFELRRVLVLYAAGYDASLLEHVLPLVEQLVNDSGLCYFSQLADDDSRPRMERCIERAKQRYAELPEHERCFTPLEALQRIGYTASSLCAIYSRNLDLKGLEILPTLLEPLRPLDPGFAISAEIVQITLASVRGEEPDFAANALIERIEHDPGLNSQAIMLSTLAALRYYAGLREACRGGRAALERAEQIEDRTRMWEKRWPTSIGLGRFRSWHVRYIAHLYNGDVRRAKHCREQIELLQLDGVDPAVRPFVRTSIHLEARAHALCGSLPELRETLDVIEELAASMPGWQAIRSWAQGEYHKARGDYERARSEFEKARASAAPGRHWIWIWASAALSEVLLAEGEPKAALGVAQNTLSACEGLSLASALRAELVRVLALCEARLGSYERAAALLDELIVDVVDELGGVPLGRLYEARARVALHAGETANFRRYLRLMQQRYRPARHPGLGILHQKLLDDADELGLGTEDVGDTPQINLVSTAEEQAVSAIESVQTAMRDCVDSAERAEQALKLLLEHSGGKRGYLFGQRGEDVRLLAASADTEDTIASALRPEIEKLLGQGSDAITEVQDAKVEQHDRIVLKDGSSYPLLLLHSAQTGGLAIAAAVLEFDKAITPAPIPWRLLAAITDYLLDQNLVSSIAVTRY